jgi:uncharacterized membrane protein YeaQ/YmgE (transglycosylase-associated protein family)
MTLTHLLVLLLVGAVCGIIGERLVGRGLPGGLIGAIVAGLVGACAAILVLLLSLLAGGRVFGRSWRRY